MPVPPSRIEGSSGHVADHELIRGELVEAEATQAEVIAARNGEADLKTRVDAVEAAIPGDGNKGDITVASSGAAHSINDDAVDNPALADMAQDTLKGRVSAGTGDPEDLTPTQARGVLGLGDSATKNTGSGSGDVAAGDHDHSGVYAASSHGDHTSLDSAGTPANLGTATRGTGTEAARDDHVHEMPTAADIAVTASGFDGNLTTDDDTVQKVAQKVDDLVASGGADIEVEIAGVSATTGLTKVNFADFLQVTEPTADEIEVAGPALPFAEADYAPVPWLAEANKDGDESSGRIAGDTPADLDKAMTVAGSYIEWYETPGTQGWHGNAATGEGDAYWDIAPGSSSALTPKYACEAYVAAVPTTVGERVGIHFASWVGLFYRAVCYLEATSATQVKLVVEQQDSETYASSAWTHSGSGNIVATVNRGLKELNVRYTGANAPDPVDLELVNAHASRGAVGYYIKDGESSRIRQFKVWSL